MNQKEWGGKFAFWRAWKFDDPHLSGVANRVEPEVTGHLLLCEVGMGHVDHCFPVALNETVGRLTTSRDRNDIGATDGEMGFDGVAEEFFVAIHPKALREPASFCTEEVESFDDLGGSQSFERKHPVVASGTVYKYEYVPGTTDSNCVTEPDVAVNFVEVLVFRAVDGFPTTDLTDSRISAQ